MEVGRIFVEDGVKKIVINVDGNDCDVARVSQVARRIQALRHQSNALDLVINHLIGTGASDNLHFG